MDIISVLGSFLSLSFDNPLIQSVLVGLVRGVVGWGQHAIEDGEISRPEFKELGATILRILPQALGLSALGIPAVGALFTDVGVTKLAKIADAEARKK